VIGDELAVQQHIPAVDQPRGKMHKRNLAGIGFG
jgi:hypothetical protein